MSRKIKTLNISFNLPVRDHQNAQWRGAFIEMAGWENDLFHNHINAETYIYRYPRIQYRIQNGKASIFAVNEGVDALQQVLANNEWIVNWEGQQFQLFVEDLRMQEHYLTMNKQPITYQLKNYLPFNSKNYEAWLNCSNLKERIILLEGILVGHILAFCTSMDWRLTDRLEIDIQNIFLTKEVEYHKVRLLALNLEFSVNIILPNKIGLGKAVSHGFGSLRNSSLSRKKKSKRYSRSFENV